jgi:hypothetical protein
MRIDQVHNGSCSIATARQDEGEGRDPSSCLRLIGADHENEPIIQSEEGIFTVITRPTKTEFAPTFVADRGANPRTIAALLGHKTDAALEQHARRVLEQQMTEHVIATASEQIAKRAKETGLPTDLRPRIEAALKEHPELSWDSAVARTVRSYAQ